MTISRTIASTYKLLMEPNQQKKCLSQDPAINFSPRQRLVGKKQIAWKQTRPKNQIDPVSVAGFLSPIKSQAAKMSRLQKPHSPTTEKKFRDGRVKMSKLKVQLFFPIIQSSFFYFILNDILNLSNKVQRRNEPGFSSSSRARASNFLS